MDGDPVGRTYGPETHEVTAEEAAEFADATDDPRSDDGTVPPMLAVVYARDVVAEMLFDEELDLDYARLVHGEQSFEFGEPVHPGDQVETRGELVRYEKVGGNLVVALQTTSTVDGTVASKGTWTFVIRGAAT